MTTKQSDLTRDKLLQAAFREIHRHGFQAASIANILRDTELTKGALYYHFPTKQELGLAVIEDVVRDYFDELIFRRLRESERPVLTLLQIIGESGLHCESEAIALGCPLNNLMQEMSPLDEKFKVCLNGILSTWGTVVEDALRREQKMGGLRSDVNCRAAALFIISAWEGCIGIAKSLQSPEIFNLCMSQLQGYVQSLRVPTAE